MSEISTVEVGRYRDKKDQSLRQRLNSFITIKLYSLLKTLFDGNRPETASTPLHVFR